MEAARHRITERIGGRESDNVGVRVEIVPAGWLAVELHSRNPIVWFHAGVDLHPDGRVTRPPSDDGCAPLEAPHTDKGTATSIDEAVELVVTEAERSIAGLELPALNPDDRRAPKGTPACRPDRPPFAGSQTRSTT